MNQNKDIILDRFKKNVDELYSQIKSWMDSNGLNTKLLNIEIVEEVSGRYNIDKLIIYNRVNKQIAAIEPVSSRVIGANGRVDLVGKYDKLIIVYLEQGGPELISREIEADQHNTSISQFFEGVQNAGWYWIEDRLRGKAHLLDKKLFLDLLSEVSDYELQ
jgi:hypothetical protein